MMVDFLLAAALGLIWQSGKAPSIATVLLCVLTYRVLPRPYDEGVTGVILIIGGFAARRRGERQGR
jgi:hypothetical protein